MRPWEKLEIPTAIYYKIISEIEKEGINLRNKTKYFIYTTSYFVKEIFESSTKK